jgi:hypothetical protein
MVRVRMGLGRKSGLIVDRLFEKKDVLDIDEVHYIIR